MPFLPERKKLGKFEKLVTSLEDKCECVAYIKSSKQWLNHGLVLRKSIERLVLIKMNG